MAHPTPTEGREDGEATSILCAIGGGVREVCEVH